MKRPTYKELEQQITTLETRLRLLNDSYLAEKTRAKTAIEDVKRAVKADELKQIGQVIQQMADTNRAFERMICGIRNGY